METEYTLEEIAEKLHVHVESVRRWVRNGKIKAHKKVGLGKSWFVYDSELNRFVQSIESMG